MNPQHIHQNMGYLPLLAEEGLKVINSFQGNVHVPPESYHHPQTSSQQASYVTHHYQAPDEGYHPHERMQGMYMGGGTAAAAAAAADEMSMHAFHEHRAPIVPFSQPQYSQKNAAPAPVESKSKGKAKKSKGGRPKKRGRDPKTWKRNTSKMLRNSGQTYVNSNGCLMPARVLKEPCKNCRQKCVQRISQEQRQAVFDAYWDSSKDWTHRRLYVIDHALPQPIQRRRRRRDLDKKARRISFHYHLTVNGQKEKVCKKFFLNTLGVGEKFVIISLHKKTVDGDVIPDRRGRHPAANQIPLTVKQEARRHIQSIIVSRPEEQMNLAKMYETYTQEQEMQQKEPVKKHFYRKLLNEELRISQQRLEGPDAVRSEERPLDYTPTPQVSALECLIKELWQKEQERISNAKPKSNLKEKRKEYHSLRFAGKEYVNFRGQVRPSRKMKAPCENCQKACTERISETQRQQLFDTFWDAEKDWNDKKKYVLSCTESHPVLSTRTRNSVRRAIRNRPLRFSYFFEVEGKKEPVCRKYFVNTLGLSHSFIASCIAKQNENGDFDPEKRKKCGTLAKLPPALAKEIRLHIIYKCWADPNKAREYQTHSSTKGWSWNVSKMYEGYRQCCWLRGTKPASTYMYRRVFTEEMRIFHESEAEVPSTPGSSTRSAVRKQGENKPRTEGSTVETPASQSTAHQALAVDASVAVSDADSASDTDEELNTASSDDSEEYVPSSDEGDDDDDDLDDEDYEPPRKKSQILAAPENVDTLSTEESIMPTQIIEPDSGPQQIQASTSSTMSKASSSAGPKSRRRWDTSDMRCAGQTYINDKGNVIPARRLKDPCQNCRKLCPERVGPEMREKIFNMFWSKEMTWENKRRYIEDCIEENAVKKRTLPPSQLKLNRKVHMTYTLRLGDWEQNVCKLFFINTLGISQKFAIVSLRKQKERLLHTVDLSSSDPQPPVPAEEGPEEGGAGPSSLEANSDNSLRDVLSHLLLTPSSSMP